MSVCDIVCYESVVWHINDELTDTSCENFPRLTASFTIPFFVHTNAIAPCFFACGHCCKVTPKHLSPQ